MKFANPKCPKPFCNGEEFTIRAIGLGDFDIDNQTVQVIICKKCGAIISIYHPSLKHKIPPV